MKKFLLFFAVTISMVSCDSKKAAADPGNNPVSLNGSWELNYITGTRVTASELYANKKPMINFNVSESKVNGNTGCNSFTGMITSISAGEIVFDENMAMTKMFCEGQGETVFLDNIRKVKAFSLSDNGSTLHLTNGDIDVMRLTKK
jgi:heat shock protein HslJ